MSPRSDTPDTHTPPLEFEPPFDYSAGQALVRGAAQEVAHTQSRRTGPRRWLRAVRWLIAAGLHGRANATTLKVAEDLAGRMDYDTGHVLYRMRETAARVGIDVSNVKRHVAYLRELGALAWVQKGSRANSLRGKGLPGYAGTATVYAAVIPACYDHAMGHRIIGTGYQARIVVDLRNRPKPVDNRSGEPVDNSDKGSCAPPSLRSVEEDGKLKMVGGSNYTSQASRSDAASPTLESKTNRSSSQGTGRHALQVAKDILIARQVRPLVNWTQREGLRRLAFSLRPLIDHGMNAYSIAEYLHGLCPGTTWRPKAPAAYISTVLADQEKRAARQANAVARFEMENPIEGAFQARPEAHINVMAAVEEGINLYRQKAAACGWEDLSSSEQDTFDAEADILAFLNGSPA